MSLIPRVRETTRERIASEFDDLGPTACLSEVTSQLAGTNPEILAMAQGCAANSAEPARAMLGLCMFYRLLTAEDRALQIAGFSILPRVGAETRERIVAEVEAKGAQQFTIDVIHDLDRDNPELLQMAHSFATRHGDYLPLMQGFCLIYRALDRQAAWDRVRLN